MIKLVIYGVIFIIGVLVTIIAYLVAITDIVTLNPPEIYKGCPYLDKAWPSEGGKEE